MKIIIEKGDTEQQVMMAEAMLANGVVRAVERAEVKVDVVTKSNEEVAKAVCNVARLFGVGAQWTAVYRVLVDYCGWDDDIVKFHKRMNTLLKDVRLKHPCTYQSIQKPLAEHGILAKNFQRWKAYYAPSDDRFFKRQMFIAKKLLELLSINA